MSVFDDNLIEKPTEINLRDQFMFDLMSMIEIHREDLLSAKRTHGIGSVCSTIDIYVNMIRRSDKYKSIFLYIDDPDRRWESNWAIAFQDEVFIVFRTNSTYGSNHGHETGVIGKVTIILDEQLKVRKFESSSPLNEFLTQS